MHGASQLRHDGADRDGLGEFVHQSFKVELEGASSRLSFFSYSCLSSLSLFLPPAAFPPPPFFFLTISQEVPQKISAKRDEMLDLLSPVENWKNYRTALSASEPPTIPYLGSLLFFISDVLFFDLVSFHFSLFFSLSFSLSFRPALASSFSSPSLPHSPQASTSKP